MTIQLLNHPVLQSLEPKTSREILLFIKAHTLGMETAYNAIHALGLESAQSLYNRLLPAMWENLDIFVGEVDDNRAVIGQMADLFG